MKINPLEAVDASPEAKAAFAAVKVVKNPFERPLMAVELHEFIAMELPIREPILSPWLMTQSLSMIYGWRGVGKTHVSLGVSYAVACGGEFLHWKAEKPRRVLLVDGEMPGPALQERFATSLHQTRPSPSSGSSQSSRQTFSRAQCPTSPQQLVKTLSVRPQTGGR